MAIFINNNNVVVISANDKLIVFETNSEISKEVCIPDLNMPPNLTKNQQEVLKNEKVRISTCAFSNCGKYFAASTTNKQLVVYDSDFNVLNNLNISRTASKIRFTNSGDIILADKTGDVYLYKLTCEKCEVVQVLGHLSMVLDVLTAEYDKYVITCDRDEKIRVSLFPTGYNIVSFCLGHEEFVLSLELYNSNTLISASGDGTIRFWNYISGEQIYVINTNDYIVDKNLIQKFSEQMDSETVEVNALPITGMKVKLYNDFSLIVCSLHCYNNLLIFKVTGEVNVSLLQIIEFDNQIISFNLSNKLCILTNTKIFCYEFRDNLFVLNDTFKWTLNTNLRNIVNDSIKDHISVLYKRKYDNVQEYQERKKLRLENKK